MRRRRLLLPAAVLATALLLAGCGGGPLAPTPSPTPSEMLVLGDGVLRIGTLLPTSGDNTALGPGLLAAVRAAVRQINAEGGVLGARVELVSRSSGSVPETLEGSFAELMERGVDVVIGPSDSVLSSRVARLAAEARVPVISPAATGPILLDEEGWLFRTVAPVSGQGALLGRLLPERGRMRVALVYTDGPAGFGLIGTLGRSLAEHGGSLVALRRLAPDTDVAGLAAGLAAAEADAVVLATGDSGEVARSAITALAGAGFGGERLWLTSRNAVDYSESLDDELLVGVNAVSDRLPGGGAGSLLPLVQREDPGARNLAYSAQAFDAVVLAALAAAVAGNDAGPAIRAELVGASSGGVPCTGYGECAVVIADGQEPDFQGLSGPIELDEEGDPTLSLYAVSVYEEDALLRWISDELG